MNFPENPQQLETMRSNLDDRIKVTRTSINNLEQEVKSNESLSFVLKRLSDSWNQPDPGKYDHAFFFLDEFGRRVVIRGFLLPGTGVMSEAERRELWENRGRPYKYDKVPEAYPIVDLAQVFKETCPHCGQKQPVAEHYVQTEDSPDYDEWEKNRLVVCLPCERITVLEQKSSPSRF